MSDSNDSSLKIVEAIPPIGSLRVLGTYRVVVNGVEHRFQEVAIVGSGVTPERVAAYVKEPNWKPTKKTQIYLRPVPSTPPPPLTPEEVESQRAWDAALRSAPPRTQR